MKNEFIKLEPHKAFKKAIVHKTKRGLITYNYYMLIEVCVELYDFDYENAQEWVEYNILPISDDNNFRISYKIIS